MCKLCMILTLSRLGGGGESAPANTGKSDVTILQHCVTRWYMLQNFLSHSKVSARTAGSQRQLNTDSIYTLYSRSAKKFPSRTETLPVYKQQTIQ